MNFGFMKIRYFLGAAEAWLATRATASTTRAPAA